MRKLRQILFLLLAINVFALADTGISENVPIKNKNITNNKKIATNYEILRDILDKRNRELKDLGFQSDYIIKPEYNEWQIFFTGFYNHSNRNSKNSTIPYVLNEENTIKSINLGKTITVREVNDIFLNPEINIQSKVIAEAPHIVIPNINLPNLNVTFIPFPFSLFSTQILVFSNETDVILPGRNASIILRDCFFSASVNLTAS